MIWTDRLDHKAGPMIKIDSLLHCLYWYILQPKEAWRRGLKPESTCCVLRATCWPSVEGATWPLVSGCLSFLSTTPRCCVASTMSLFVLDLMLQKLIRYVQTQILDMTTHCISIVLQCNLDYPDLVYPEPRLSMMPENSLLRMGGGRDQWPFVGVVTYWVISYGLYRLCLGQNWS